MKMSMIKLEKSLSQYLIKQLTGAEKNWKASEETLNVATIQAFQVRMAKIRAIFKWLGYLTDGGFVSKKQWKPLRKVYKTARKVEAIQQQCLQLEEYEDKLIANYKGLMTLLQTDLLTARTAYTSSFSTTDFSNMEWANTQLHQSLHYILSEETLLAQTSNYLNENHAAIMKNIAKAASDNIRKSFRILLESLYVIRFVNKRSIQSNDIKEEVKRFEEFTTKINIWSTKDVLKTNLTTFLEAEPSAYEELNYQILKSELRIETEVSLDNVLLELEQDILPKFKAMIELIIFYGKANKSLQLEM